MANCERCNGNEYATLRRNRPAGGAVDLLHWLCLACLTGLPVPEVKRRGLAFWRRLVYQVVLPVMGMVFVLVELGLHL